MRFLIDECTGTKLTHWLRKEGYEVFSVYEEARGITDEEIIKKAFAENWIVITNDKDFGEKVYRQKYLHIDLQENSKAIATIKVLANNKDCLITSD